MDGGHSGVEAGNVEVVRTKPTTMVERKVGRQEVERHSTRAC